MARKNYFRRGMLARVERDDYTRAEIAERDSYTCQLCGDPVDMGLRAPDRMSATIDHVVPLSVGGNDTRSNVQLAHWSCNSRKGATAA